MGKILLPPVLYSRLITSARTVVCVSLPQAIFLMPSSPRRSAITVAVFLAACAAAGTLVQRTVGAQAQADESTLRNDLRSFTTVYSLVE